MMNNREELSELLVEYSELIFEQIMKLRSIELQVKAMLPLTSSPDLLTLIGRERISEVFHTVIDIVEERAEVIAAATKVDMGEKYSGYTSPPPLSEEDSQTFEEIVEAMKSEVDKYDADEGDSDE